MNTVKPEMSLREYMTEMGLAEDPEPNPEELAWVRRVAALVDAEFPHAIQAVLVSVLGGEVHLLATKRLTDNTTAYVSVLSMGNPDPDHDIAGQVGTDYFSGPLDEKAAEEIASLVVVEMRRRGCWVCS